VYGYPLKEATEIAMTTVKEWLESNADYFMEVIFCCYDKHTYDVYTQVAAEKHI